MRRSATQLFSEREWVLANGLGGYALGFGDFINKRKYNGLLTSAVGNLRRIHTLAAIEEKVESGGNVFFLDSNHYSNCIYPNGYTHIIKSWFRPYPAVLYSSVPPHDYYLIFKEIFLFDRQNAVAVKYSNVGKKPVDLFLRPKLTLRDHHGINYAGTWDRVSLEKEAGDTYFKVRRSDNGFEAYGYVEGGHVWDEHLVYRSVFYPTESVRGYDASEDLVCPYRLTIALQPGAHAFFIVSSTALKDPAGDAAKVEQRYKQYPLPADHPDKIPPSTLVDMQSGEGMAVFDKEEYCKLLDLAARDFVIEGDDIVAGYPWFGVWSRDTMISLSGLKYLDGGRDTAIRLLKRYGPHIKEGLIPNTFGEGGEGLNYDSVDAPLWYVLRCYEYAPSDKELFKNASSIVLHYIFDEHHPFFVAEDDLIEIRRGNQALTWMDAKVYDQPVTPRWGKPVEVNALWYNVLRALQEMAKACGQDSISCEAYNYTVEQLRQDAEKTLGSLKKFVGPDYLADRIEGNQPIWEIRPNAVIAASLPFDFVEGEVLKKIWQKAKDRLLTPYGLRSLDPAHPAFKQKYVGSQKQRDLSYHQGTVWAFLTLPFVKLAMKVLGPVMSPDDLKKEITQYVWAFRNDFMRGEMASVAELWDGIDPFIPKGCPAQAWSVFALFEIEHLLMEGSCGKK